MRGFRKIYGGRRNERRVFGFWKRLGEKGRMKVRICLSFLSFLLLIAVSYMYADTQVSRRSTFECATTFSNSCMMFIDSVEQCRSDDHQENLSEQSLFSFVNFGIVHASWVIIPNASCFMVCTKKISVVVVR